MKENKEDVPPNSRIFVLHSKNASKEVLRQIFEKYGQIEDVWMVRDKKTGDNKGVTYIKFSKMSEAARAVEEMNGVTMDDCSRPLKVIIANARDEGSKKDDDIEKYLRLFIVIPKDGSETEETLHDYFSKFGQVKSVNILKNRDTKTAKGFAYVKFAKISHSAKALEECDSSYKCVLAKPKEKRNEMFKDNDKRNEKRTKYLNPFDGPSPNDLPSFDSRYYNPEPRPFTLPANLCARYASDKGYTKVIAFISTKLTEDLALRLFELTPGLIFARMCPEVVSYRTQKMYLEYSTPEAASFAVDKLNKFEYPIGEPIMMKPEVERGQSSGGSGTSKKSLKRDYSRIPGGPVDDDIIGYDNYKKLTTITTALVEATSLIKSHGVLGAESSSQYCSAMLPPVRPIAKNEDGKYRLFIVCQPEALPLNVLKDVFCRFGHMVDAYLIPHKNYGYVHYSSAESANKAIAFLHGEEICGNRLKVLEADPPPRDDGKKLRFD